MYQIIKYFPYQIILINVKQLTWNEESFIENLFRAADYHYKKLINYMAEDTKFRSALKELLKK